MEERLAEVTAQVSYATRYRHLHVDKERFAIQSVPPLQRRTPWYAAKLRWTSCNMPYGTDVTRTPAPIGKPRWRS